MEDIKIKKGKLAVCTRKLITAGFTKEQAEIMCSSIAIRDEIEESEIIDTEPSDECVSEKIKIFHEEHPEWEYDQVVAAAHGWCRTHGNKVSDAGVKVVGNVKSTKETKRVAGISMKKFATIIKMIKSKKGQKVGPAGILPFKVELPMKNLNRLQTKFEKLITAEQEWLTAEELQKRSQYAKQMKKVDSLEEVEENILKEIEENIKSIIESNPNSNPDELEEMIFDSIKPIKPERKIWVDSPASFGKANFGMNNIIKAPITLAKEMTQKYRLQNDDGTYRTETHFKPYSELKKAIDGVEKVYMIIEHKNSWVVMDTIGCVRNLYADDKSRSIRGMGYFIESKIPAILLDALKNEKPFGVSIGFMAELGPSGNFNGIDYDYTQTEMILDHLAICIDSYPRCPTGICGVNVGDSLTVDSTEFTIINKNDYYYNINDILYKSEKIKTMNTDGFKDPKSGHVAGDEPDMFVEMLGKLRKFLAGINDTDKKSSIEDQVLKIVFGEKKKMNEEEFKDALTKKETEINVLSDMVKDMKIKEILSFSKRYTDAGQLKDKSLMEINIIADLETQYNPSHKKPPVLPMTGKDADDKKKLEDKKKKFERIDPASIFADVSKGFILDSFLAENFGDLD